MITTSQVFRNMNAQAIDAQQQAYSATKTQQTGESGKAMGYAFKTMVDPGQTLMDAMEEISMSFEEKKLTEIGKRELGEIRGKSSILSAAIDKWMKMLPGMPNPAQVEVLLQRARQLMAKGGSARSLLRFLQDADDDPTEEYALLDILENAGGIDKEALVVVRTARQMLQQEKGSEIQAGLNLAEVVNARAEEADELKSLRNLYRNEVLGFKSPQECFRSLLAQRGTEGFGLSIDFLVEACGVDIQSASPSKSKEELSRILGDLQCVDSLTAVLDRTKLLVSKMSRQFGETPSLDGTALLGRLVDLTEKAAVSKETAAALVKETGIRNLLAQLYFTTSLQDVIRQLSPRLFEDESVRQRLVDAVQEHLDDLVAAQQKIDEKGEG